MLTKDRKVDCRIPSKSPKYVFLGPKLSKQGIQFLEMPRPYEVTPPGMLSNTDTEL